jgi:hypothetical protein
MSILVADKSGVERSVSRYVSVVLAIEGQSGVAPYIYIPSLYLRLG